MIKLLAHINVLAVTWYPMHFKPTRLIHIYTTSSLLRQHMYDLYLLARQGRWNRVLGGTYAYMVGIVEVKKFRCIY